MLHRSRDVSISYLMYADPAIVDGGDTRELDSNTHHGQLQTRRKSYDTKWTLQPLTQARIQTSKEGIAATNLPPRSGISQDPKRSSQQITPLYNAHRNATKKNTQQHNRF